MHYYEYEEVVKRVEGLNSISSLKRWRKLIEERTGIKFKSSTKRIGRRSATTMYLFSEEDILKLQEVANLKNELGLEKAIVQVFSSQEKKMDMEEELSGLKESVQVLIEVLKTYGREIEGLRREVRELQQEGETKKKRKFFH
ncbi:TPA: hypothetical protein IUT60_002243 [Enterococcus faecalis]|uniref:hypothetical protein n=1 Tax=Enterococcus faecalis TaxID=1351 RepID=UPI000CF6DA82|nr:hypothetical protein [Enterococcus faecalis]PQC14814.1 hypothetical protein CUM91_05740 [Enterococcus faecalis]HAP3762119.1 hypothetical protein [Enterococcus faecalis]